MGIGAKWKTQRIKVAHKQIHLVGGATVSTESDQCGLSANIGSTTDMVGSKKKHVWMPPLQQCSNDHRGLMALLRDLDARPDQIFDGTAPTTSRVPTAQPGSSKWSTRSPFKKKNPSTHSS